MPDQMADTRSQTPSRRPTTTRRPPRRHCSPARGATPNHSCACSNFHTTNPHTPWGKKRARTAPSGSRTRTPAPPTSGSGVARDWADIGGDGPTGLVAELVLANDLADYVRFRAVCHSWRRCSPDPRAAGLQFGRFLPRRWIMLDKAHAASRRHRFLNVCTGECIRTDLPELAEHTLLALSPEGLLLLFHEPTLVVRLLNPLTRRLTELPPVTALLIEQRLRAWRAGISVGDGLWVYGVGLADASTVAVCFGCPNVLAVARPGDEHWTVVDDRYIDSTLSCAGRFYCVIGSNIMVLDTSGPDQQPPRLRQLVAMERSMSFPFRPVYDSLHLVDNARELMLVHRMLDRDTDAQGVETHKWKNAVFRVDLDAGALAPAKVLRGRAVFMSLGRTISVSPGAFSSVTADTLYLGFDFGERTKMYRIDGHNVADGSSEPSYHYAWRREMEPQPCSVVDCLSYCIQGNGDHLA